MARWIGPGPEHDHIGDVLAAAEAWRDRCFLTEGSLFGDENLWTLDNIRELKRRVIDNPIKDKRKPIDKIEEQLKSASPQVIRFAAEVLWFLYLFLHSKAIKPKTKLSYIEQIWKGSRLDLPNSDHLDERALRGVGHPGPVYQGRLDRELGFLMQVLERWRSEPRQSELMMKGLPWDFSAWLDETENSRWHQIRHMTLYFLFPDHLERSVSEPDKQQIFESFKYRLPAELQSEVPIALTDLDRALFEIRRTFEEEYETEELDFYEPPLKHLWKPDRSSEPTPETPRDEARLDSTDPAVVALRGGAPLNTILYGPPGTGKTYATARRCVEICYGPAERSDEDVRERYGELVKERRVEFITFHQSYGYEEFVEDLRPVTGGADAGFRLQPEPGVLKRIAQRARESEGRPPHVLVIDEINRANVSKVMGELVTLLEEDKREGAANETAVTLPYSGDSFTLPANLHVLGTMNTADRSIALLDTALRRRFEFKELPPDPDLLTSVDGIDLPAMLDAVNKRLEWLLDRDHLIGHAWLMEAKTKADVDRVMQHKIVPLIVEYFYDDWEKVRAVLGGGDDFVRREQIGTPPGLDDDTGETRYRWKIRDGFTDEAYRRLVAGKDGEGATPPP